jgi:soluble lytic murein transglycosylase-like protein
LGHVRCSRLAHGALASAKTGLAAAAAGASRSQTPLGSARTDSTLALAADKAIFVDKALVKAIVANEFGFDPNATSSAGSQGLMQLEPATAAGLGVSDPYDPSKT